MSDDMHPRKVCVIGAGAAGLTSIKVCIDAGLSVTAFEQTDRIGGLWNINSSSSSTTITNSSSRMSAFSDFPIPNEWPAFLPRHRVIQYLNDYADHFDLRRHIQFCCMVVKVEKSRAGIAVTTSSSITGDTSTSFFDFLMLCSGHHTDPVIPVVPGSQKFAGKIIHSKFFEPQDYDFTNKTVVVIGSGNSAADAAVESGDNVILAMRSGNHFIRRTNLNGAPVDEVFLKRSTRFALQLVAPFRCMRNALLKKMNHVTHFDPKNYDIPKVKHGLLDKQAIINDMILPKLISGKLKMMSIRKIDYYTRDSVVFLLPDETKMSIRCDMVIYGTGYRNSNQLIDSIIGKVTPGSNATGDLSLYRKIIPPHDLRIGVIGHIQPLGPQFPLMEMQARYFMWINWCGSPPSIRKMNQSIEQEKKEVVRKQRSGLEISWYKYMTTLAKDMGVEPSLWKLFFTNQKLFRTILFDPMIADQYPIIRGTKR